VGYSPDGNDVSTEAEESPLLRAVTKQRLVKTLQAGEDLACSDFLSVGIGDSVVVISSYDLYGVNKSIHQSISRLVTHIRDNIYTQIHTFLQDITDNEWNM
jgi:hypothetical protein